MQGSLGHLFLMLIPLHYLPNIEFLKLKIDLKHNSAELCHSLGCSWALVKV